MDSITYLNDLLNNVRSKDDALKIGSYLRQNIIHGAKQGSFIDIINISKEEYFDKMYKVYMRIIKKHYFAKDYSAIFKHILRIQ